MNSSHIMNRPFDNQIELPIAVNVWPVVMMTFIFILVSNLI